MTGVFVVIPAYNETGVIQSVIRKIRAAGTYTIVLVDDGSANPIQVNHLPSGCHLLRHIVNLGQGAAIQTGITYALGRGAKIIVTFDADDQHDAADIEKLIAPILTGESDIVLGSRFLGQANKIPLFRRMVIQLARIVHYFITGWWMTDAHNGIRAISRHAALKIRITENRMAHATEILMEIKAHRLRWKEVPVSVIYTTYSMKKGQSSSNAIRVLFDIILYKLFK